MDIYSAPILAHMLEAQWQSKTKQTFTEPKIGLTNELFDAIIKNAHFNVK